MKGLSDEIQLVAAVVLCCIVFVMLWPRITQPSLDVYGHGSAFLAAELIAHDINSLSVADAGRLERTFSLEWDVEITKSGEVYYVRVSHEKFRSWEKGKVPVIANVELSDVSLTAVKGIVIEKKDGIMKITAPEEVEDV